MAKEEKNSPGDPRINIPPQARSSFTALLGLADTTFNQLLKALENSSPAIDSMHLSRQVATSFKGLSFANLRKVIGTLSALYAVLDEVPITPAEFVTVIRRGVEREFAEEQNLSSEDLDRLEKRLSSLLNLKALEGTHKAAELLTEHQQYMANARILTDIRPIFGRNVEEDPVGALLVHTLKLGHYRGQNTDNLDEFYVALDEADIDRLIDLLENAKKKGRTLQRTLKTAEIPHVEANRDEDR